MKRIACAFALFALLGLVMVGCEPKGPGAGGGEKLAKGMGQCPVCGMIMPLGAYCAKDNAISAPPGVMVRCDKCNKDYKAGEYDAKCNKFMMPAKKLAYGPENKMEGQWGDFCPRCEVFIGATGVTYDKDQKKPVAKN